MKTLLKVPYVDLASQHAPIKAKLLAAVEKVLDSGQFILGDEVKEFETRFAALCGTKYAIGLNSGTDAIVLALKAMGIGAGDQVITAPNSYVTTASAIVLAGAKPVFVDVNDEYLLEPSQLEKAITPKTKAILPVHLTGRSADMKSIETIAKKYKLKVIEDCAQAVIAEYHGRKVGSLGDVGCFSLHPLKTLNACGDGGVVTTNDQKIYESMRVLRDNGCRAPNECVIWSANSRLDTIQAAMLLVKLDHLEQWTQKRREHAKLYQNLLSGISQITVPMDKVYEKNVYHTFVIQAEDRDRLKDYLAECGIGTKIHYATPIHLQDVARELGYKQGAFPKAEAQAQKILSLPVYPELTKDQIEYVAQSIKEFYKRKG